MKTGERSDTGLRLEMYPIERRGLYHLVYLIYLIISRSPNNEERPLEFGLLVEGIEKGKPSE
jgi:hypothetical protein